MTWAPPARRSRAKTKRFTRRQLGRLRLAELRAARGNPKEDKREAKRDARELARTEAAFEGCDPDGG